MKVPDRPPPSEEIWREVASTPEKFATVRNTVSGPSVNGKYLHWDKLQHLEPPKGLNLRAWWAGLKFHRMGAAKSVPLVDGSERTFRYSLIDPLPQYLHEIDLLAGGLIQIPEPVTNPATRDRYIVRSLIEEAITSSQLEGAVTTRKVAKEMIKQGRRPRDRNELMILNNYNAMRLITDLRDEPLSESFVLAIHRMVTEGTLDDPTGAGRLRTPNEYRIVGDDYGQVFHRPPPAEELEGRFASMCRFANGAESSEFIHPAIRSIILHFWLAYDHPFVDGNGRTARALFYWSMLKHKYWLFEFISISQIILKAPARYGTAFLQTETDDNDLTYFLIYHAEVIFKAVKELNGYVDARSKLISRWESEYKGIVVLNPRQRELIGHALRHPSHHYTVESHRVSHKVSTETARTDLMGLVDKSLLIKKRAGHAFYFTPAPGMEEKLMTVD